MQLRISILSLALVAGACSDSKKESTASSETEPSESSAAAAAGEHEQPGGYCSEFVTAAMLKEHCGQDVELEPGMIRGPRCGMKVLAGNNVAFKASFIRMTPETYETDQRNFPPEPTFEEKGTGGMMTFSVYPVAVSLLSSGPNASCTPDQLKALAFAVKDRLPTDEEAPEVAEVPSCEELLPANEVEKVCGKSVTLKDSGMSDGNLNICNHGADGVVFLLTRHRDNDTAQKGLAVASGGQRVADRKVHGFDQNGEPRAVATAGTLLLELKANKRSPCNQEQLVTLAEGVVSRLP